MAMPASTPSPRVERVEEEEAAAGLAARLAGLGLGLGLGLGSGLGLGLAARLTGRVGAAEAADDAHLAGVDGRPCALSHDFMKSISEL